MPTLQQSITASTPMGARLVDGGATFRVWVPDASQVYVAIDARTQYVPRDEDLLVEDPATHHWTGFVPNVTTGTAYRFWVVGKGSSGFKRDPYARELHYLDGVATDDYENSNGIVVDPGSYTWLSNGYRPPAFHELIVYQLHVGVFHAVDSQGGERRGQVAKLLDVVERLPYLADLGVNAIQPLPFVEFWTESSKGYNGTDLYSPEMDYCASEDEIRTLHLPRINALLASKGHGPKTVAELVSHANQLKLLVDLCHLHGIAVIADVVFNHAGGAFNAQSIDHYNRPVSPNAQNNLYFDRNGAEWAGGRVFEYEQPDVEQFLIDNARMFLEEYRMDGLRHDEVRVIDRNNGRRFLQDLTSTLHYAKSSAVQIAEYWDQPRETALTPGGMGFDLAYDDRLREAVRNRLSEAAGGENAKVRMSVLADELWPRSEFQGAYRAYTCLENHDLLDDSHTGNDRKPRIARLAGGDDARSWYATSRARVANAVLLTAPGTPMLFMGQEFLEDKYWSDNPKRSDLYIYWDGLENQKAMSDFHRFMRDLCWLRRNVPALSGEGFQVLHVHDDDRVLVFQRWIPGRGQDVVIVVSFSERTYYDHSYQIGFPHAGHWNEIFNSDVYEAYFNPNAQGNYGGVDPREPGLHGLPYSAGITIPANSVQVFQRVM